MNIKSMTAEKDVREALALDPQIGFPWKHFSITALSMIMDQSVVFTTDSMQFTSSILRSNIGGGNRMAVQELVSAKSCRSCEGVIESIGKETKRLLGNIASQINSVYVDANPLDLRYHLFFVTKKFDIELSVKISTIKRELVCRYPFADIDVNETTEDSKEVIPSRYKKLL